MQIQSIIPSTQAVSSSSSQIKPAEFALGKTVNAIVSDISSSRITLKLDSGALVVASKEGATTMRAGDSVQLTVTSNGSKPSLSVVSVNDQPVDSSVSHTELMLMQMNVEPSSVNTANIKTLQNLSLPIIANTLARMNLVTAAFPELSAERAAVFASSDMPVTAENVNAFLSWLDSPVNVTQLAQSTAQLADSDPNFAQALRDALSQNITNARQENTFIQNAQKGDLITEQTFSAQKSTTAQAQATPTELNLFQNAVTDTDGTILQTAQPNGIIAQNNNSTNNNLPIMQQNIGESNPNQSVQENMKADNVPKNALLTNDGATNPPTRVVQADLPSQSQVAAPLNGANFAASVAQPLSKVIDGVFRAINSNAATQHSENLREAVTKLPENVLKLSNALNSVTSKTTDSTTSIQQASSLFTQLQIGAEMGTLLYTQIPLRSNDTIKSADLYIMKRDKDSKSVDAANATVAICLDTDNMGLVESIIRVERNELALKFRVENERIRGYMNKNLNALRALDFPAQYRFTSASVVVASDAINPTNAANVLNEVSKKSDYTLKGIDITV